MTAGADLVVGAVAGMAVGAAMVPVTRRQLAAALARSEDVVTADADIPSANWHPAALVLASGLLPGLVLLRAGWSVIALPPLLLLIGLVQLAYCDLTRFLLPKMMVHALTAGVAGSAILAAALTDHWHRLAGAALCGAGLFLVLFAINLANPAWIAFGDVRLSPAVGLGLAWISPVALFQGFMLANVLAAVAGLVVIATQRGTRKTALPFGLFLAAASALIVLYWS
ncbi:MAG TPA: hypothetical protein VL961_13595 [Acidimicrobiales bacterium]|nr:hypothetical protein [Acidimicrobiales bacterium]